MLYNRSFDLPEQDDTRIRHRCRNPKCGSKLKSAVTNSRDAFCSTGCFTAFYRRRCLVCERAIIRGTERQLLCGRQKCKGEFRRHKERFLPTRYLPSGLSPNALRNPIKPGTKTRSKIGRGFVQIAGPALSPTALHLATLPLDPELVARLERANHQAARACCLIKPHHPPVNVVGGYKFPNALEIDFSRPPAPSWAAAAAATDCTDIPEFLRRSHDHWERNMEANRLKVGDRVAITVSLSDREGGKGTVRGVHGDTADVEMDNGHWATVLSCHLYRVSPENSPSRNF